MRLYSRNQVTGIVVATVIVTSLGIFLLGRAFNVDDAETSPERPVSIGDIKGSVDGPTIELMTNVPSMNVADASSYTQDEAQNIGVYERANEAVVNITTETVGINWFLDPVPQEGGSG